MPVGLLLFLNILETFLATDQDVVIWDASIALTMAVLVLLLLCRARSERMRVRRAVMRKLFEKRGGDEDLATPDTHLQLHAHDIRSAHATCSCYPKDVAYLMARDEDEPHDTPPPAPRDLCTCLWDSMRCLCCGWCCGCWVQLCGMCAIGQEDREIQLLLDKGQLQVDYITFQPYGDYFPEIQQLRATNDGSVVRHWRALSLLSYNLVKILATCLIVLTIVSLLQLDPKFQIQNLVIVLATFTQAFLILFFCHWQWNRFDLSTDALVKYFASGFVLCTFLAIVYEILISSVLGFLSYVIVVVGISQDVSEATSPAQVQQAAAKFAKEHVGIFAVFVFLNAFVVAATVEETCKYFGYWMVETPDLLDSDEDLPREMASSSDTPTPQPSGIPKRSRLSHGAGITIAMIAVAAGFACSENLLYVFIYTPPGLTNEIATLVSRSMFPIHPLCAAIQSIGVVRRDVEKNHRWQMGRIMFPAIMLHGAFDFVLMILALIESSNNPNANSNTSNSTSQTNDAKNVDVEDSDTLALIISVSMVIVGLLYYFCESQSQKKRLAEMDAADQGDTENLV
jgi:RsiW-degrading membrane proteinase PrsW (M82 family)